MNIKMEEERGQGNGETGRLGDWSRHAPQPRRLGPRAHPKENEDGTTGPERGLSKTREDSLTLGQRQWWLEPIGRPGDKSGVDGVAVTGGAAAPGTDTGRTRTGDRDEHHSAGPRPPRSAPISAVARASWAWPRQAFRSGVPWDKI
ncbi:hypothetical protein WMY93_032798 [Mugilogobius chulae]|uniref:Uncharacterized protein n=1 Tax=Mugilogobius chulae TaxID=88201 RepID=A0AAW0MVA9_9GOBI